MASNSAYGSGCAHPLNVAAILDNAEMIEKRQKARPLCVKSKARLMA
jgi:hypothetical protein